MQLNQSMFSYKTLLFIALLLSLSFCSNADSNYTLPEPGDGLNQLEEDSVFYEPNRGSIQVNGSIASSNFEGQSVLLFETEGREFFLVDSSKIVNGKFSFNQEDILPGIFKIGLSKNPNKLGEIILNPVENEIALSYKNDNFAYGLLETYSTENKALKAYTLAHRQYLSEVQTIKKGRLDKKAKQASLFRTDEIFKKTQDALASQYSGTFLAKMVSHLQSGNRFDEAAYWNDLDFEDKSLIHSQVFPNRIEDFMRIHASKGGTAEDPLHGFFNAVDVLANKIKENGDDDVLSFVLYTMSEGFYSSGLEEVSLYVLDNYFYGDGCGDSNINALFKMRASGIRNLQIGNTPPAFSLNSNTGQSLNFQKIAKANKYTLVLFWASFCHKCEVEIPNLKPIYTQFNSLGFEVIGVSVDTDKNDWLDAIESSDLPWLNVSDLAGWKGQVAKDFRVTSTPVFFLVNQEMEIVQRPNTTGELRSYLSKNL